MLTRLMLAYALGLASTTPRASKRLRLVDAWNWADSAHTDASDLKAITDYNVSVVIVSFR